VAKVEKQSKSSLNRDLKSVGGYLDLGLRLTLSLIIGVVAGRWGDDKLGTSPLFLLLGLIIGMAAGFLTVYRAVFPPKKNGSKRQG
jgi:F0F1-type ATP synthase assembly protein I